MPILLSDFLKIDSKRFDSTGAFNSILDTDSRLFVDPFLLPHTSAPELQKGREKILDYFGKILRLIAASKAKTDATWRQAERMLTFPEAKGFGLGYGGEGGAGSGMGPKIRNKLLETAAEIVSKGIVDPVIFELVGIFQEGIGCDRVSDMACRILYNDFLAYSSRILESLGINKPRVNREGISFVVPRNPARNGESIILLPRDILCDLPIAHDWDSISHVCATNSTLRTKINAVVGADWQKRTRGATKEKIRELLIGNPDLLRSWIDEYKKSTPQKYDFQLDPSGEANWLLIAKDFTKNNPLSLSLPPKPTLADLSAVVDKICENFKQLVEHNGLWTFLYKESGKPKHERAAQLIFYAVSSIYCEANGLDVARECDAGRGPVDFKISKGRANILVEAKLSTNGKLHHAYDTQLPIYQKAERSSRAILLILRVKEKSKPLAALLKRKEAELHKGKLGPDLVIVDALPKTSASKAPRHSS